MPPPTSIFAFLEDQDRAALDALFGSRWCCVAVLQSLPSHARAIVQRLVAIRTQVSEAFVLAWFGPKPANQRAVLAALAYLQRLALVERNPERHKSLTLNGLEEAGGGLRLHLGFAESLQRAFASSEDVPWQRATQALPLPRSPPPAAAAIERHAGGRWNAILHFLVGTCDAPPPEPKVVELLISTGLLALGSGRDPVTGEAVAFDDDAAAAVADSGSSDVEADGGPDAETRDGDYRPGEGAVPRKRRRPVTFEEIRASAGGGRGRAAEARAGAGTIASDDDVAEARVIETHITRAGYEFLLKDTSVQMWTFMCEYVSTAEERHVHKTDILAFLFLLGFCRVGEGYAVSALTETQRQLLDDFQSFGLVFVPPLVTSDGGVESAQSGVDERRFYPTSLALVLTQPDASAAVIGDVFRLAPAATEAPGVGPPMGAVPGTAVAAPVAALRGFEDASSRLAAASTEGARLQLICEKNFKVFAYTSVDLHVALLALFCRVELRLPNLVVATLTRRSVLTAFERGISARQIAHFLRQRLLPVAAELGVPENVVDQLVIWQEERHRCAYTPGVLVAGFETKAQFLLCADFARAARALEWADEEHLQLIVRSEQHAQLASFMEAQGMGAGRRGR